MHYLHLPPPPITSGDITIISDSEYRIEINQTEHQNITVTPKAIVYEDESLKYKSMFTIVASITADPGYNPGTIIKSVDEETHTFKITATPAENVSGIDEDGFVHLYQDGTNFYTNSNYTNRFDASKSEKILVVGMKNTDFSGSYEFMNKWYNLKEFKNPYLTKIGFRFLRTAYNLHKVELPNLLSAGDELCLDCNSVESVDLTNLQTVGNYFLTKAVRLKSANLPNLTSAGSYFLNDTRSLEDVNLPNLDTIYTGGNIDESLRGCSKLKKLDLPKLKNITGTGITLYKFYNLEEINLPVLEKINNNYFLSYCFNLKTINAPSLKSVGNYGFDQLHSIEEISLPSLETVGSNCFYCDRLKKLDLPKLISAGDKFLNTDSGPSMHIEELNLPSLKTLGNDCIKYVNHLKTLSFPSLESVGHRFLAEALNLEEISLPKLKTLGSGFLQFNHIIKVLDFPSLTTLDGYYFLNENVNLKAIFLRSETMCKLIGNDWMGPKDNKIGTFYVPEALIDQYKADDKWKPMASQFASLESCTLHKLTIIGDTVLHPIIKKYRYDFQYNEGTNILPEHKGVTWSVTGNATIDQDGLLAITNPTIGDTYTITLTSTVNSSISTSITVETKIEKILSVDLNNGQFVDTGELQDNLYPIYKSDAGSYNIDNGSSVCTVHVKNYSKVTVYLRNSGGGGYDFSEVSLLDNSVSRDNASSVIRCTGTDSRNYAFLINDVKEHTFQIMYSKDYNGNQNDDRAYFYLVPED